MTREKVYTVPDWYDGPRRGVADYCGKPNLFESTWNNILDVYGEEFLLWEISAAAFEVALEDWAIWRRWERAFVAGETRQDTHPVLPEDRARHEGLRRLMTEFRLEPASDDDRLAPCHVRDPNTALRLKGKFRASGYDDGHASLEVCWTGIQGEEQAS